MNPSLLDDGWTPLSQKPCREYSATVADSAPRKIFASAALTRLEIHSFNNLLWSARQQVIDDYSTPGACTLESRLCSAIRGEHLLSAMLVMHGRRGYNLLRILRSVICRCYS